MAICGNSAPFRSLFVCAAWFSGKKYTLQYQALRTFVERKKAKKLAPVGEKHIREIVREEIRKKA